MQLQFLGATDTVTGSKYLVRHGSTQVLVDCVLFQGYKQLRLRNWARPPLDPAQLDAVVLTHAHIDHSGYLPLLVRLGFRGKVFCTHATHDLARILLPDSGHLQEEEAEYMNRHGLSRHEPALPLYTREDAMHCLKQLRGVDWRQRVTLGDGLALQFEPAGHMPGAAVVRLGSPRGSLVFSGDLGRPHDLVLKPPALIEQADHLVVESTYGNKLHPRNDPMQALADVINRTAARGGIVLMPAFAIGRAQLLLHCMDELKRQGRIHHLPVYLNSPMAASALRVYLKHRSELRLTDAQCEALAESATIVETPDESRALNARKGPMVIIAASGMATGGRVVHHLKAFAPHARNSIVFAGYQAGGTRGAAMTAGEPTVRIHGEDIAVRAEVVLLDDLSAHADSGEIMDWLHHFKTPPRTTFITHGEPPAADALRLRIERELRWKVHMPHYLETVALG